MDVLVPEYNSLADMPWTWVFLLHMGAVYKSYQEMSEDSRPPRKIWTRPDLITEWFAEKKQPQTDNPNTTTYTRR